MTRGEKINVDKAQSQRVRTEVFKQVFCFLETSIVERELFFNVISNNVLLRRNEMRFQQNFIFITANATSDANCEKSYIIRQFKNCLKNKFLELEN